MLQGYIYICGGSICMSAVYHVPVNTLHTTFMIILTCHAEMNNCGLMGMGPTGSDF